MSRSPRIRAKRLGATIAAAGLVFALAPAAPAGAETAEGTLNIALSSDGSPIQVGTDGDGKVVFVSIDAENAVNPVLTIKISHTLGHEFSVTPLIEGCTTSGDRTACPVPTGTYKGLLVPLRVKSAEGAQVGAAGDIELYAKPENSERYANASGRVTIGNGVDLVVVPELDGLQHARPGDTIWMPATFGNEGNRTADNPAFSFYFMHGLAPEQYDGCEYTEQTLGTLVKCPLGESLPHGRQVTFVTDDGTQDGHPGMAVKVTADAVGYIQGSFFADPGSSLYAGLANQQRSRAVSGGKRFAAQASAQPQQDLNGWDNSAFYQWQIPNLTDIAALGSSVTGKVGDTVKATIGIKNVGTASVVDFTPSTGTVTWEYNFTVPAGTTVVSLPDNCFAEFTPQDDDTFNPRWLDRPFYTCFNYDAVFSPGQTRTSEFGLKITKEIPGVAGAVSFKNPYRYTDYKDDNAANDNAQVIVNPAGGPAGGDPGNGTDNGFLPVTGAQIGAMAGVGGALLIGGAALFVMARRRRVVLVAPEGDGE